MEFKNLGGDWMSATSTIENFFSSGTTNTIDEIHFTDGTTQTTAGGGSGFSQIQTITSSGTFTVPASVTKMKVTVTGGGQGGRGSQSGPLGQGCTTGTTGYSGNTCIAYVAVTPEAIIPTTVGAGGSGGISFQSGAPGGNSLFGSYITAYGGAGVQGEGEQGGSSSCIGASLVFPSDTGGRSSVSPYGNGGVGGTDCSAGQAGTAGVIVVEY